MKREIKLIEVESAERVEATHIEVQLYYSKGGMNYFTGGTEARGFYLSVTPVSISHERGYTSRSFIAFSGIKKMVLEVARFNQKKFDEFVPSDEDVKLLVDYVTEKNGIKTKE